jgi:hypothetical protein
MKKTSKDHLYEIFNTLPLRLTFFHGSDKSLISFIYLPEQMLAKVNMFVNTPTEIWLGKTLTDQVDAHVSNNILVFNIDVDKAKNIEKSIKSAFQEDKENIFYIDNSFAQHIDFRIGSESSYSNYLVNIINIIYKYYGA